jgi:prolyl oligopeptidase
MLRYANRSSEKIGSTKITDGKEYYYLKRLPGENKSKLYYRKDYLSKDVLIYDPANYKALSKEEYSINYYNHSWDNKYVVISLSSAGKEISDLIIFDTQRKVVLEEVITNAWPSSFLGVQWLPDNSGFTFLHFPQDDPKAKNFKMNTHSVLYKIGDSPNKLKRIFGSGSNPELKISRKGVYPIVQINHSSDKYIIGYLADVDNFWSAYYAPVNELNNTTINWKPFFTKEQKIETNSGDFKGDEFIYKSARLGSNFTLESISMNDMNFNDPKILVSELNDQVLGDFKITKDKIYFSTTKNGVESLLYEFKGGSYEPILLPKTSGSLFLQTISKYHDNFWIYTSGWTSGLQRFKYDNYEFISKPLSSENSYAEFADIIAEEVLVQSHDGILVPLSIIRHINTELNSQNPTLFYGYGAYGTSITPFFAPYFLTWVEDGGILCIPHVRGGGEKGDDWYRSGLMHEKSNSWKDLIACTEYMINEQYTSSKYTAIYSMSAGGILVGKAMTDRPDLFKAVVAEVPILNPLRHENRSGGGGSNIQEYGTVDDSLQFLSLVKMDPYMSLKPNTEYPSIYITAGDNDPRVPLWMPGKFAAKFQNYNTSNNTILFNIDFEGGHGSVDDNVKFYEEYANLFSFCFWQTGHPDYQLKEE